MEEQRREEQEEERGGGGDDEEIQRMYKLVKEAVDRIDNLHMYLSTPLHIIMERVIDAEGDFFVRQQILVACRTVIHRLDHIADTAINTVANDLLLGEYVQPSSPDASPAE